MVSLTTAYKLYQKYRWANAAKGGWKLVSIWCSHNKNLVVLHFGPLYKATKATIRRNS